jgi:hypothetical protein
VIEPGQRVRHWFAGTGRVERVIGWKQARVRWDRGGRGIARVRDLRVMDENSTTPQQQGVAPSEARQDSRSGCRYCQAARHTVAESN